jgi:hypothetical protein
LDRKKLLLLVFLVFLGFFLGFFLVSREGRRYRDGCEYAGDDQSEQLFHTSSQVGQLRMLGHPARVERSYISRSIHK